MPYRPPIHRPVRADRPGKTPRPSQAGSFYFTEEWKALRRRVLDRDRWTCQVKMPGCLRRATIADHRIPRDQGGSDSLSNLRACCRSCHNARHPEKGGSRV